MINVLIVDDSSSVRNYLAYVLGSDPQLRVVGQAKNGNEALQFINRQMPDVVTMDINMPVMDGLETTRKIMETTPVPIVIISANWEPENVALTFRAVEAGAISLLTKPTGIGSPQARQWEVETVATIKQAAMAKVRRLRSKKGMSLIRHEKKISFKSEHNSGEYGIVVIGASTGGPPVIKNMLSSLPADFPVPIMLVQHISSGFTSGFAQWLDSQSQLKVFVASHSQRIRQGCVYVAPEGFHMSVRDGGYVTLSDDPPEYSVRPAVSYLFKSAAQVYKNRSVGVLLTGMGSDGAAELKLIRNIGGVTFAQDKASSVVHGMPGKAVQLDSADYVLPPDQIIIRIMDIVIKGIKTW